MACNAWNHPAGCNCGWGGDTGGGGRRAPGGTLTVGQIKLVDGCDWRPERRPRYETYVNPNASCPVCGDSVYYYQSPHGGRVFFDELGPPWPKHPCTDKCIRRDLPVFAFATGSVLTKRHLEPDPNKWQPLIPKKIRLRKRVERVEVDPSGLRIPGRYLYLPRGCVSAGPAFWRRTPGSPGKVDVSTIEVDHAGTVRERVKTVPCWYQSDSQRLARLRGGAVDGETLNAIGWSLSFAWRSPQDPEGASPN
jgi:hypothetical protein